MSYVLLALQALLSFAVIGGIAARRPADSPLPPRKLDRVLAGFAVAWIVLAAVSSLPL